MATSTQTLVATVKAELVAHLPALATTAGVDVPVQFLAGEPELVPTTKTPTIGVCCPSFTQEGFVGSGGKRTNEIIVHIIVAASDPETLESYLDAYLDIVVKLLESEVTIGTAKLSVTGGDSTPNISGGNQLFRHAIVTAELRSTRNRGDA